MSQATRCHGPDPSIEELQAENERLRRHVDDLTRMQETALAELRHRVGNHFQLLASLIGLRLQQTKNSESREHLLQLRDCVLSLGRLQTQMETTEGQGDFGYYLAEQAALWRSLCAERKIALHVEGEDVRVAAQKTVPLALVVNELVTNCLKHAFPAHTGGSIRIRLKRLDEGQVELSVIDDGVGGDIGGKDQADRTSFGLTLIRALTVQLDGSVEIETDRGTTVRVCFLPD
ncbi:sensor histidine kinase [Rhodospirillaceae bacterium SYSU D60014]|uniref:sensor histidine kinase n=1 Tax=Virgifigura deserti TaxID=2268457 RepID=UPI000E66CE14